MENENNKGDEEEFEVFEEKSIKNESKSEIFEESIEMAEDVQ